MKSVGNHFIMYIQDIIIITNVFNIVWLFRQIRSSCCPIFGFPSYWDNTFVSKTDDTYLWNPFDADAMHWWHSSPKTFPWLFPPGFQQQGSGMVRNGLIQTNAQGQLVFAAVGRLHKTGMTSLPTPQKRHKNAHEEAACATTYRIHSKKPFTPNIYRIHFAMRKWRAYMTCHKTMKLIWCSFKKFQNDNMNPWHLDPSPDKSASIWWDMTKGCTMPSVFAHMDNVAIEVPSKVSRSIKSQFLSWHIMLMVWKRSFLSTMGIFWGSPC